jgi:glycosyltransferase involved in cell wall biosynthesis
LICADTSRQGAEQFFEVARVPRVSVIIPVFNRQGVLRRAVDSVLSQTFSDYELIVVDDGSTEPIADVLSEAQGKVHLRLLRHEKNRGAASARNTGAHAAEGRYLAFLDSDDTWHREKLARQIEFMQAAAGRRMSCTGVALVSEDGIFDRRLPPKVSDLDEILWGCRISPGTTLMVERALWETTGPMNETLGRLEDWDWMILAAKHAPFHGLREILAEVHHDRYAHVDEATFIAAARRIADYTREERYGLSRPQKMILLSAVQYELAATYYRKGRFAAGLGALTKSFLYCPWKRPGHALAALNTVRADIRRALTDERGNA